MNLSQMLFSKVTPLSEYEPMLEHKPKPRKVKDSCSWNVTRHAETIEKYRSAWKEGEEWLPTKDIEDRLGMGKAIAHKTLKKWHDEYKIIERRPHGKVYNPCVGYEWRWKSEDKEAEVPE